MIAFLIVYICFTIGNSTKNNCFFKMFCVGHGTHAVISYSIEALTMWSIFNCDPTFLIKHIHVYVVKERSI